MATAPASEHNACSTGHSICRWYAVGGATCLGAPASHGGHWGRKCHFLIQPVSRVSSLSSRGSVASRCVPNFSDRILLASKCLHAPIVIRARFQILSGIVAHQTLGMRMACGCTVSATGAVLAQDLYLQTGGDNEAIALLLMSQAQTLRSIWMRHDAIPPHYSAPSSRCRP